MWHKAADFPMLDKEEVHVWFADLDRVAQEWNSFWESLDPEETARAGRYVRERDRLRFAAGRAILRRITAGYLQTNPRQVGFDLGVHGKPHLAAGSHDDTLGLQFNVSHSGPAAVFGFVRSARIGIDIECVDRWSGLPPAARYFPQEEQRLLQSLSAREQKGTFFQIWTQKEAFLKANGTGLGEGLSQDWLPRPAGLTGAVIDPAGICWSFWRLAMPAGLEAALVVEGLGWQVECFAW